MESLPVFDQGYEAAVLRVHGQRFPNDPVEVFGTSEALERLVNALIDALESGRGRCGFLASDGHPAEVRVAVLDGTRRPEDWRRSGSPYLDIEDPLVARLIELSDEVQHLRHTLRTLSNHHHAGVPRTG